MLCFLLSPKLNFKIKFFKNLFPVNGDEESGPTLPRKEVVRKLRDRGEPILLYGESELEAFKRLRKLEILEPESNKVNYIHLKKLKIIFVVTFNFLGYEK